MRNLIKVFMVLIAVPAQASVCLENVAKHKRSDVSLDFLAECHLSRPVALKKSNYVREDKAFVVTEMLCFQHSVRNGVAAYEVTGIDLDRQDTKGYYWHTNPGFDYPRGTWNRRAPLRDLLSTYVTIEYPQNEYEYNEYNGLTYNFVTDTLDFWVADRETSLKTTAKCERLIVNPN